ncbi:MAG TPA: Rrf2 family transcriptional regulator [Balneolaceae bacterium]|nr:Rrf2 family transcriptional regulator [Balneolaceae bacterium]
MKILSKSGIYGVLACLYLDRYSPAVGYIAVKEIGQKLQIPYSYLSKIIQSLSSSGIVKTRRGSGGGIALNVSSSQILVKQIVEAVEGPIAIPNSLIEFERPVGGMQFVSKVDEWLSLKSQIEKLFDTLTLERLSSTTDITVSGTLIK